MLRRPLLLRPLVGLLAGVEPEERRVVRALQLRSELLDPPALPTGCSATRKGISLWQNGGRSASKGSASLSLTEVELRTERRNDPVAQACSNKCFRAAFLKSDGRDTTPHRDIIEMIKNHRDDQNHRDNAISSASPAR